MGLDEASPHSHSGRGSYMNHSSASPPPYLSSHSPNPMSQNHHYSYPDNIVYTPLGELSIKLQQDKNEINFYNMTKINLDNPVSSMLHLQGSTVSDLSNDSSPAHGYPDFPASPDSIFGENASTSTLNNNNNNNTNNNSTNNQSSSHY